MIDNTKLSKDCSYILRHALEKYDLISDSTGWIQIRDLLSVLGRHFGWKNISESDIKYMINGSSKKRHEIVGGRIRAIYGHSTEKKIEYENIEPPLFLYHGTAEKNIDSILEQGLLKQSRQYVHLSTDFDTASQVARRHDSNIAIFKVDSQKAWEDGVRFYHPNDNIWLADYVSQKFLTITSRNEESTY